MKSFLDVFELNLPHSVPEFPKVREHVLNCTHMIEMTFPVTCL